MLPTGLGVKIRDFALRGGGGSERWETMILVLRCRLRVAALRAALCLSDEVSGELVSISLECRLMPMCCEKWILLATNPRC